MKKIVIFVFLICLALGHMTPISAQSKLEELGLNGPVKMIESKILVYDKRLEIIFIREFSREGILKKETTAYKRGLIISADDENIKIYEITLYDSKEREISSTKSKSTKIYDDKAYTYKEKDKNGKVIAVGDLNTDGKVITKWSLVPGSESERKDLLLQYQYDKTMKLTREIDYNNKEKVITREYDEKERVILQRKVKTDTIEERTILYDALGRTNKIIDVTKSKDGIVLSEKIEEKIYIRRDSYDNWTERNNVDGITGEVIESSVRKITYYE